MSKRKQKDYSSLSMHELFCVEVEGQSLLMVDGLLELEKNPGNDECLEVLMRSAHSIKGAARLVNIKSVEDIAHVLEECFVAAQNNKIILDESNIDTLLKSVDVIKEAGKLTEDKIPAWEDEHSSAIKEHVKTLSEIVTQPNMVPARTSKKSTTKKTTKSKKHISAESDEDLKERIVRVSADRLSRLMGLSGELLITTKWISPYTTTMLQLKKRQNELTQSLDTLKEILAKYNIKDSQVESHIEAMQEKSSQCRLMMTDRMSEMEHFDRRMSTLSSRLYREVISSTMRPFSDGVQGFNRMVRDIAKQTGKKVEIDIQGLDHEVDRDVLEKIEAPLTHLIRNAIDHGIESPEARKKAGKLETGKITLSAIYSSGMLSVILEDDGKGVDYEDIRTSIVNKGMINAETAITLTDMELLEFLFLPKFSTREKVTELSGRGVGLDVVRKAVQEIRGLVHIQTVMGKGTRFTLQLPLTLSVVPALVVEISGESYAFPLTRIFRVTKVSGDEILRMEGQQYITVDDEYLGLISGSQVFGRKQVDAKKEIIPVVIVSDHLNKYGVVVDELVGQRELVVQSLDPRLGNVKDISAASVLEDGRPTLIIDVDDFVRSINGMITGNQISQISNIADVSSRLVIKKILIVDDSITVRGVERNLLETNGYEVVAAVDGMDGWNTVRSQTFDLVITDVDMPRMDGIELVQLIKKDPNLGSLPVMIVSYKDMKEDKARGMEAGADYYLTKGSFHDETLLEAVIDLIGEAFQ